MFLVVTGLPKETFVYFDQNRARNARDALKVRKVANAGAVASAAKLLHQIIVGHNSKPRNEVVDRMVQDYPALEDAVIEAEAMKEATHGSSSVLSVLYFLYGFVDPEACKKFFQLLQHGSEEFVENDRHPVARLKKKLTDLWKKENNNTSIWLNIEHNNYGGYYDSRFRQMCFIHTAFIAYLKDKKTVKWTEKKDAQLKLIEGITHIAKDAVIIRPSYNGFVYKEQQHDD